MTPDHEPTYQLAPRPTGSALFGLRGPQILLLATGLTILVLLPSRTHSPAGLITALILTTTCSLTALIRIDGDPLYHWAITLTGFTARTATGRTRWTAPLPLLTGTPPHETPTDSSEPSGVEQTGSARTGSRWTQTRRTGRRAPALPRCLAGLDLLAAPRPDWAGGRHTLTPVGLVRDRRHETLTIVLGVRGSGFALLDPADQHARIGTWGNVLAQFGRDTATVTRLGWTLHSAPTTPGTHDGHLAWLRTHHTHQDLDDVDAAYHQLLADTTVYQHDLRVWISVAAAPPDAPHSATGVEAALTAGQTLTERCAAAGLVVSPPLSPVQIAEAIRHQADPTITTAVAPTLAELTGITAPSLTSPGSDPVDGPADATARPVDTTKVTPLAVNPHWDHVQVDGAFHRTFWVSTWPHQITDPTWLGPLLIAPPCPRTLALSYEPVSARTSRRAITAEAVTLDAQRRLRERHDLRVPVGLHTAHHDIDQREAELAAGHHEMALLALITLTETTLERLNDATRILIDQAARSAITSLRPLHARHDAAWACTLPLGRTPDHELLRGLPT